MIAVIGAGASGIIASLKASESDEVILIDKNDQIGKKLLVTGNGHCNYWHDNINVSFYNTDNLDKLENILTENNINDTYDYLCSLGIYPKIKNGYYYPYSNQAYSIRTIFEKEINKRNIKVLLNKEVIDIKKKDNGYDIILNDEIIYADKVILACGLKAGVKNSNVFDIEKLGFKINPILPSLCSLYSNDEYLKQLSGVRCESKVSLYIDDKFIKEEEGELQLTDYGLSGICIFNLSSKASKALYENKKVSIKVNFLPFVEDYSWFEEYLYKYDKPVSEILETFLSYKIINVILKNCHISINAYYKSLTDSEKLNLKNNLISYEHIIYKTSEYSKAQVCTGGISLDEVSDKLMTKLDNFYITGEALDVDGMCGGYNLAFAFITGFIAGSDIK